MRRAVPAARRCCRCARARRLRREGGRARAERLQARRADARLLPERRPRRHLRGRRRPGTSRRPGSTWRSASRRTRRRRSSRWRPAGSTWRSPTSPRCCGRATRACTSSPSARSCRSRSRRSSRCRGRGSATPEDLTGKTVGTAGIDYQSAYLRTILPRRGVRPGLGKERNVGFDLVPALLTGKVDAVARRLLELRGHASCGCAGKHPRIIRIEQAGVPTYDELVLVANADALERDGRQIRALHRGARRAARATCARIQTQAIQGLLKANPDLDPELQRAVVEGHAAAVPAAPQGKPFGWQDPDAMERVRRLDAARTILLESSPTPAGRSRTSSCPAPGSRALSLEVERQRVDAVALAASGPGRRGRRGRGGAAARAAPRCAPCVAVVLCSSTPSATAGSVKLGQPVPESYFVSEPNSSCPQAPQR